jgi:hypothetical protein
MPHLQPHGERFLPPPGLGTTVPSRSISPTVFPTNSAAARSIRSHRDYHQQASQGAFERHPVFEGGVGWRRSALLPADLTHIIKYHGDFDDDSSLVLTETDFLNRLSFDSAHWIIESDGSMSRMTRLCAECAQAGGQHSASKADAACDRFVHGAQVHIPFSRVLQLIG